MIELKNLRIEHYTKEGEPWSKLVCDILSDEHLCDENTLWVSVKQEDENMLSNAVYDPFVLVPYALGSSRSHDIRVHGKMSKTLYKNMKYISPILQNFADYMKPVRLIVDGFDSLPRIGGVLN